jgi:pyruvate/2-oxoglutarate/acetoin dehydrogenase E1 component
VVNSYLVSIRTALHDLMEEDDKIIVIGEDIVDPYGGAYKVTKGLSSQFPTRVFATPISESAIIGVATGMAIRGFKPIAEIMFGDFLALTADQLLNSASKFSLMYKNDVTVPLIVRTPMGGGRGYGPTHSQCLEKMFLGIPGLMVICPSLFHAPGQLLKSCIRYQQQPVLFIEYKNLYTQSLEHCKTLTISHTDGHYPTAIVKNSQFSPDVIIVSYGGLSEQIMDLMIELQEEEINICAIFPSLLSEPIELESLAQNLHTCRTILVVDNNTPGFGWVSETAAQIYAGMNVNELKIERMSARDTVVPVAKHLENDVLVTKQSLQQRIFEILL